MSSLRDEPIGCDVVVCGHAAVTGGIVVVQPNGMSSSHAVYYACADHSDRVLAAALQTWPVGGARPQCSDDGLREAG